MAQQQEPQRLADLQRAPGTGVAPGPAQLPIAVERVRTFDTPEVAGMRFLEVEAKSALNRVKGMGFGWSINPYRGCSHACSYCLSGETPILMADGRTKPLAEIAVGDGVYGTERVGSYRRYVTTTVQDHWSVTKPAYRVVLEDGTRLVASADHRFLTRRGWKHVTGADCGGARRPHLTGNDDLLGTGHVTAWAGHRPRSEGSAVDSPATLRVVGVESLGIDLPLFDITTGTGDFIADGVVSHNCFARPTHAYLNLSPLGDFERSIVVKTNVAQVLQRELARPSWRGEHVAMGTNTDPYQRCEGRYRLMPDIIAALAQSRTPFSILTKGTVITRDLGVLAAAARDVEVGAAFTVGMLDDALWRASEPGTPSPSARLAAVRALNDAGVATGVMLAPIMPGLNDGREQLDAVVDAAVRAGAVHVSPIVLHLRPGVRELFWPWLEATYPHLVARYAELYQKAEAPKSYRQAVGAFVAERRRAAWGRHGRPPVPGGWRGMGDDRRPPAAAPPTGHGPGRGGPGRGGPGRGGPGGGGPGDDDGQLSLL